MRLKFRSVGALAALAACLLTGCAEVPLTLLDEAEIHSRRGEWQQTIAVTSQIIADQPDNVRAYLLRGRAKLALERFDEAMVDCEQAIELAPDDPDGYYQRAMIHERLGNDELAEHDNHKARQLDVEYAVSFDAHYTSGRPTPTVEFGDPSASRSELDDDEDADSDSLAKRRRNGDRREGEDREDDQRGRNGFQFPLAGERGRQDDLRHGDGAPIRPNPEIDREFGALRLPSEMLDDLRFGPPINPAAPGLDAPGDLPPFDPPMSPPNLERGGLSPFDPPTLGPPHLEQQGLPSLDAPTLRPPNAERGGSPPGPLPQFPSRSSIPQAPSATTGQIEGAKQPRYPNAHWQSPARARATAGEEARTAGLSGERGLPTEPGLPFEHGMFAESGMSREPGLPAGPGLPTGSMLDRDGVAAGGFGRQLAGGRKDGTELGRLIPSPLHGPQEPAGRSRPLVVSPLLYKPAPGQ